MTPRLSIVVPAFNEAANVPVVVERAKKTLADNPWTGEWELILVDDGSRDGTAEVIDRLAADNPRIRALHHQVNRGLGAALMTGYEAVSGEYVTWATGDGELGVDQTLNLLKAMGDADLIVSRRERSVSAGREVLSFGLHLLIRLIVGMDLRYLDGAYVIRRDVLSKLSLRATTGMLNLEIPMRCRQLNCRITSGTTKIEPRLSGESKVTNLRTIVRQLWDLARLR